MTCAFIMHFNCLKIILDDIMEKLFKPNVKALLQELVSILDGTCPITVDCLPYVAILWLCLDSLTSGPTMDLLSNKSISL